MLEVCMELLRDVTLQVRNTFARCQDLDLGTQCHIIEFQALQTLEEEVLVSPRAIEVLLQHQDAPVQANKELLYLVR